MGQVFFWALGDVLVQTARRLQNAQPVGQAAGSGYRPVEGPLLAGQALPGPFRPFSGVVGFQALRREANETSGPAKLRDAGRGLTAAPCLLPPPPPLVYAVAPDVAARATCALLEARTRRVRTRPWVGLAC